MTKQHLSDDDFSLDGDGMDNSVALADAARSSLNLPPRTETRNVTTSKSKKRSRSKQAGESSTLSKQPMSRTK